MKCANIPVIKIWHWNPVIICKERETIHQFEWEWPKPWFRYFLSRGYILNPRLSGDIWFREFLYGLWISGLPDNTDIRQNTEKLSGLWTAAEISAGNQKGMDNTIIKFYAHNNINESLLKATNLLF